MKEPWCSKKRGVRNMKRGKVIIPLLIGLMLFGCGSKSSNEIDYAQGATSDSATSSEEYEGMKEQMEGSSEASMEAQENQINSSNYKKTIDKANLTIEVIDFDKALEIMKDNVEINNGYMQSSNINHPSIGSNNYRTYRRGEFVIRIPKENFQSFLNAADNIGVITNESTSSEDITKQYYDTETRLKVYEAQETRYLDLLKEAETMEDILTIEKQLTEVRYNIEYLTGYKNEMKDLVDYGTISIYIQEVDEPTKVIETPKNLGDKIINTFLGSLSSLKYTATTILLIIIAFIPYGIIFGIIGYIALYLYRRIKKNDK